MRGDCRQFGRKQQKIPVKHDKRRYERRNRFESMFGRLKDWRRVANRYDRCPKVFLSATALAAVVIHWLWIMSPGAAKAATLVQPLLGVRIMHRLDLLKIEL